VISYLILTTLSLSPQLYLASSTVQYLI